MPEQPFRNSHRRSHRVRSAGAARGQPDQERRDGGRAPLDIVRRIPRQNEDRINIDVVLVEAQRSAQITHPFLEHFVTPFLS